MKTPKNDLNSIQENVERPNSLVGYKPDLEPTIQDINTKLERYQTQENSLIEDMPDDTSMLEQIQENYTVSENMLGLYQQQHQQYQEELNDVFDFQQYIATGIIKHDSGVTIEEGKDMQAISLGNANVDLNKIANVESNNNYDAKNPTSSARGKYQFIDSTRNEVRKQLNVSEEYANTPTGQEELMNQLTKSNIKGLEKAGIPVNTLSVYAVHQQGRSGGVQLINAYNSGTDVEGTLRTNVVNNTPDKYRNTTSTAVGDWMRAYSKKLL